MCLSKRTFTDKVMVWSTTIQMEGFGEAVEHEWLTVRSWDSFTDLFADAVTFEGVTYCESPKLLLELLTDSEYALEELTLLVGDRDEYRSSIEDVAVARQLQEQYTAGRLTVYFKKRKVDHAKLYRAVEADGTVTLIVGSANLSYNSWKNQANTLAVYRTTEGSTFDEQFQGWLEEHWEDYGDEVFLADLVERLEDLEDPEDRDQLIELWIDNRASALSERGEVHTDLAEEFLAVGREIARVAVLEDTDEADETVALADGDSEDETLSAEPTEIDPADVETDGPITRATTTDLEMKLSTQSFDPGGYADSFSTHVQHRGAKVGADAVAVPVQTYTSYLEEQYDQWRMWIDEDHRTVHLQIGEQQRVFGGAAPTPAELDTALAHVEDYVETVDRWGETNHPIDVMAHMYEGVIFGLWAPFINLYATGFFGKSTLDKSLQYLFIYGNSDAGKDQFTRFVLQLLSDGLVEGGADGDDFTKTTVRALREIDTCFPYVVSDVTKQRIEQADPLRNFWEDAWSPDLGVDYPAIIFTSNDSRPKEWFRNRSKLLYFDVVFPSNPDDEGFHEAQRDLNRILEQTNPLFGYLAHELLERQPYREGTSTVEDVRGLLVEFYERAGRELPEYFPAEGPAERVYDIGKRKWENAYHRGAVSFERLDDADGHIVAEFDLEGWEVYTYQKVLPKRMRPEKSGRTIVIKNPEAFLEWADIDPLSRRSWLPWR